MFKSNGKNCSLLGQLQESESPRLFGVDPIVRYFPPTTPAASAPIDEKDDLDDSDDDVCFGPITFKELRKASVLVKNRQSEVPQSFLSALQAEVSVDGEVAPQEAPPLETVHEFSLEEANFSGCQLPELNFSAAEEQNKEQEGLFTLAFISELAKKLEVTEATEVQGETTQWHDAHEHLDKKQRFSDVSLLSDELEQSANVDADEDKNDTTELLNDTIDRMERLLGMGVDYLDHDQEPEKEVEKEVEQEVAQRLAEFEVPLARCQKLFSTPLCARTPAPSGWASAGSRGRAEGAHHVHQTTPFRPPKGDAPRSADFKLRLPVPPPSATSRLPKPVRFRHVASPVSQYIHAPNMAPKINSGHHSPRQLPPLARDKVGLKANLENASPLPFVDYDSATAVKVIESAEKKAKAMPSKIRRLLPSPGSVLRHTGRVNIPETSDGRHELSIMYTQDAFIPK